MANTNNEYVELYILIFSSVALFACLVGFIVYFVVLYQNKQLKNKQEQADLEANFRQEMLKAQIEVQEQTLTHISREIHDNITQVLSFVKLNLAMLGRQNAIPEIAENRDLVTQVINDLRALSKSLNFDYILKNGLKQTIETEVERINKSKIITATLSVEGERYALPEQSELVLFRIFQEALNNTLKYSGAQHFNIGLQYHPEMFNLSLYDDGCGFSPLEIGKNSGLGLKNMETRAALIGAKAAIDSAPGKGCSIKIALKLAEKKLHTDGRHQDRVG